MRLKGFEITSQTIKDVNPQLIAYDTLASELYFNIGDWQIDAVADKIRSIISKSPRLCLFNLSSYWLGAQFCDPWAKPAVVFSSNLGDDGSAQILCDFMRTTGEDAIVLETAVLFSSKPFTFNDVEYAPGWNPTCFDMLTGKFKIPDISRISAFCELADFYAYDYWNGDASYYELLPLSDFNNNWGQETSKPEIFASSQFNLVEPGIYRDLNPTNFIYNEEEVVALLNSRCRIIKGELAYNTTLGIPLGNNKDTIDLAISEIILATRGVKEIKEFKSSIINHKYSGSLVIDTIFNTTVEVTI